MGRTSICGDMAPDFTARETHTARHRCLRIGHLSEMKRARADDSDGGFEGMDRRKRLPHPFEEFIIVTAARLS